MPVICKHGGGGVASHRCGRRSGVEAGRDALQRRVAMGSDKMAARSADYGGDGRVTAMAGDEACDRSAAIGAKGVPGGAALHRRVGMGKNHKAAERVENCGD